MFIKQIACGEYHMAAIEQTEGGVYTWGKGSYGALGTGTDLKQLEPKKVVLEVTVSGRTKGHLKGASYVDCGYCTTAAIINDGELWTWGAGSDGRLGQGPLTSCVGAPSRRADIQGRTFAQDEASIHGFMARCRCLARRCSLCLGTRGMG